MDDTDYFILLVHERIELSNLSSTYNAPAVSLFLTFKLLVFTKFLCVLYKLNKFSPSQFGLIVYSTQSAWVHSAGAGVSASTSVAYDNFKKLSSAVAAKKLVYKQKKWLENDQRPKNLCLLQLKSYKSTNLFSNIFI